MPHSNRAEKSSIGSSAIKLGWAVSQSIDANNIIHLSKPFLDDLRDNLKESIILEVLMEGAIILGFMAEVPGPIRLKGVVGQRRPPYASAGAKVILAFSPPEVRDRLLDRELEPLTPNTITDRKVIELKNCLAFLNGEVCKNHLTT